MSLYSLSVGNISRAKMQSTVAHFAYISGEEVENEKNGKILKYKREDKVLAKGNILPEDAPARFKENAANWINDIEQFEKADNARPAKRVRIALPEELDEVERLQVLSNWIRENCTKYGYAAFYAIHSSKDGKNPHAHVIISNRALVKGKWQQAKSKTEYRRDEDGNKIPLLDEKTGKQKVIVQKDGRVRPQWQRIIKKENRSRFDRAATIYEMRESWARCCNQFLSQSKQIDHRSYKARGIVQAPTIHEGYAARAIEKRGGVSWKCQHNREVKALNRQYNKALFEENALEDRLEGVQSRLSGVKGAAGKVGGAIGSVAGTVKGAVQEGVGAILGQSDGRGMQGVIKDTAESIAKSLASGDLVGALTAPAKMPLAILKNVESEDVKRDKMREEQEKADGENFIPGGKRKPKKKDKEKEGKGEEEKGKGTSKKQEAPVRVRGR